jgi:hypothetical protein
MDLTDMRRGFVWTDPAVCQHKSVAIFSQYADGVRFPYKADNSLTTYAFISFCKRTDIL